MAADERWYFTKEEINNSPSRKCGVDAEKELTYRQQGAKLIQDMGQRLQVTQLVINTAIVYMHRFYMFHPFTKFHRNCIAPAALFLAAKVEEQPRKLEHVIKVAHYILPHQEHTNFDTQSESYSEKAQELVMNENILLQTLGFDVAIDHPHTYVVKCFQMVRTTTELAQTSYFMATNSLHMTTMCLQYKPAVVACVCIYIVCKWSNYEIQRFTEGKDWFFHVDPTVTLDLLETLTSEFLTVLDKYPNRLKKLMNSGPHGGSSSNNFGDERARHNSTLPMGMRPQPIGGSSSAVRTHDVGKTAGTKSASQPPTPQKTVLSHKEYSEKKEKERRERERAELREKHALHPPVPANAAHHVPSAPTASVPPPAAAAPPPHISHPRSQPQELAVRKSHPVEIGRQPVSHSSAVRANVTPAPQLKEPIPKRDLTSNRSDEKSDKPERTSSDVPIDSAKLINDKIKSSRHLENVKDRKEVKHDVKSELKDIKPTVKDGKVIERDHAKLEVNLKLLENKQTLIKNDPAGPLRVVKGDRDEFTLNSCIFNNNDFSLRDFLNPSEMPPEDIFDTDSKPPNINSEFLPAETTHRKLNTPPKQVQPFPSSQPFHIPVVSSSPVIKGTNTTVVSNSSNKQNTESSHTSIDSKGNKNLSVNLVSSNTTHGSITSDKNVGNGLPSVPNSLPSNPTSTLQVPSRKKEKSPRPAVSHISTSKLNKVQNLPPDVVSLTHPVKTEEHKSLTKELNAATLNQNLPKVSQPVVSLKNINISTVTSITLPTEKTSNLNPMKLSELGGKPDTSLNIKLPRPENCSSSTLPPPTAPTNSSTSSVVSSPVKKHKRDHTRHKHKEKKKHKHKEKDKCKEKESKEHKKVKKHKRHKEKKDEKQAPKEDASSRPLKITISRSKGICAPEVGATNVGRPPATVPPPPPPPVQEKETPASCSSSSSNLGGTPGRIKLTIPKSRLQQGGTPVPRVSPPRGLPPKENTTPKVKVKIQKDHLRPEKERESRKRDREKSPAETSHPSKYPRSSSSYNPPQVGKNPLLPHSPLKKKSFPHAPPLHAPPQPQVQPALSSTQPPPPPYDHQPPYPVDQYGMNMGMNYQTYIPYGGVPAAPATISDPTFAHGAPVPSNNNNFYPQFYHYSVPLPNVNLPPPLPGYQGTAFNMPPPGYPHQSYMPPQSQPSQNPPLPAGSPPKKPPTPPPPE